MEKTVQFPNNHLIFFSLIKMNCLKKEITLNVIQKKEKKIKEHEEEEEKDICFCKIMISLHPSLHKRKMCFQSQ